MKLFSYSLMLLSISVFLIACNKDFLEEKPSTNLVIPNTLDDLQRLLDNSIDINRTCPLPQLSSDEYFIIDSSTYIGMSKAAIRNSYIWASDIYNGEIETADWSGPYKSIFYANSVLEGLRKIPVTASNRIVWNNIRGWALFVRSYAFYDLVRNYSKTYNIQTASSDPGIPLRLSPNIDEVIPRSSVEETYSRIIADLVEAKQLLFRNVQNTNPNRPSQTATSALLSRVYLSMGKYDEAEKWADTCLNISSTLLNYNGLSTTNSAPFPVVNPEILFVSIQGQDYTSVTFAGTNNSIGVDSNLIKLYHPTNDLRLNLFYTTRNIRGNFNIKRGYYPQASVPFTGLALDEVYINKAECQARRNEVSSSMATLNTLLVRRFKTGTFIPLTAVDQIDALNKVLVERRKELVWRGLRWTDLKRLNMENYNLTLFRKIGNQTFSIVPNDKRYVFPIPNEEIINSGISQNPR